MKILKRNGEYQALSFDKILFRLKNLCKDESLGKLEDVDYDIIAQKVVGGMYDGVSSAELDEEAARIAIGITDNLEYGQLASRIIISNMHKSTSENFSDVMERLYNNVDKSGNPAPVLSDSFIEDVRKNSEVLNKYIDYKRDYLFDYHGYKRLESSYLMKIFNNELGKFEIVERPQHLYMRVAVALHGDDLEGIFKTYTYISQHYYTHASPTIFNSGARLANLSSCFLLGTHDSLDGIYKTITDCARISKVGGGIGFHISNIRAKGSVIRGTNGTSDGIVPMLKVYNETSTFINQSGKRKGSFAVYLEPHHPDILEFLDLKKQQGHDNVRARDLFYAVWVSDLFMKRVEENGEWALFCPDECPGLSDCYGEDYERLYNKYYEERRYKKIIKAQEVWTKILDLQIETGVPYIGFKDAVNRKSNQKNLGTTKSSNLCVAPETMILTSDGYQTISLLEDQEVQVWNGEEFSTTTVKRTGTGQELIKVKLSNSLELECTPYHKFYVDVDGTITQVEASNLQVGQKLIESDYPVIEATKTANLSKLIDICNGVDVNYNATIGGNYIKLGCTTFEKTTQLKYLLNTLGSDPEIVQVDNNEWSLTLHANEVLKLYNNGFNPEFIGGLALTSNRKNDSITVESIITTGRISDTFCFTEELRGMGIFNGILTGQCMEISLYSDDKMYQVCNLLSLALPKYIEYDSDNKPFFNHTKFAEVAEYTIGPMNNVIDRNYYPVPETKLGNMTMRPLAIGVQGLADVYFMMGIPYDSDEAEQLNKEIFESLYYGCMKGSIEQAKKHGPYERYHGSPFSEGKFQFDLAKDFDNINLDDFLSGRWDWEALRCDLLQFGTRNSMLTSLMPTASSSHILNNYECFEPVDSHMYKRRALVGEQLIMNKHLVKDLQKLGLWSKNMKDKILLENGSIQNIEEIPKYIKDIYKTCWEISMKRVIKQAADRGVFVDQMQSMNLFISNPTIGKLTSAHFYSWKQNLKTGIYYLRSQTSTKSANFGVDANLERSIREKQSKGLELTHEEEVLVCSIDNKEACMACTS